MISVEEVLSQPAVLSAARGNDVPGIVLSLNAKTFTRTNTELISSRAIISKFGPSDAGLAMGGLKSVSNGNPLLEGMWIAVNSSGINFADPVTQAMLDSLIAGGVFSSELGARLKALGVITESLADRWYGRDATEEDAAEIVAMVRKRDTFDALRARFNAVVAWLDANPLGTVEQGIARFGQ